MAHGSAATWEGLEMVASTVNILRRLSKQFNDVLGTKHAPAELATDVSTASNQVPHSPSKNTTHRFCCRVRLILRRGLELSCGGHSQFDGSEVPLTAGTGDVVGEPQLDVESSGEEFDCNMEDALGEMRHHPLDSGDAGDGPGDEAAMPRRTEADVAFEMDAVVMDEDEDGAETDSDGEIEEEDGYLTDEEV